MTCATTARVSSHLSRGRDSGLLRPCRRCLAAELLLPHAQTVPSTLRAGPMTITRLDRLDAVERVASSQARAPAIVGSIAQLSPLIATPAESSRRTAAQDETHRLRWRSPRSPSSPRSDRALSPGPVSGGSRCCHRPAVQTGCVAPRPHGVRLQRRAVTCPRDGDHVLSKGPASLTTLTGAGDPSGCCPRASPRSWRPRPHGTVRRHREVVIGARRDVRRGGHDVGRCGLREPER